MRISPENLAPLNSAEFMEAYSYAGLSSERESCDELLPRESTLIETSDGFTLGNTLFNRFGFALKRHFGDRDDKLHSFLWRFFAFQALFKHEHELMSRYLKGSGNDQEIHHAVFHVVATHALTSDCKFDPSSFFAEVQRIARLMESDETSTDA